MIDTGTKIDNDPSSAGKLTATEFNHIPTEIENAIKPFMNLDENDSSQLYKSVLLVGAKPIDTISDFRLMDETPEKVFVSGYNTKDDGAFGSLIFKKIASGTDNNGTIIETVNAVYELQYSGKVNVKWFGAKGDGIADDRIAIQFAFDASNVGVDFGDENNEFVMSGSGQTIDGYGQSIGDTAFDLQLEYAILVSKKDFTVDFGNATIKMQNKTAFNFYRCENVQIENGSFVRTGADGDVISNQSSAIVVTRSHNCVVSKAVVDGYYRNIFIYRASACRVELCESKNGLYYCYYGASTKDVSIGDAGYGSIVTFAGNYALGGKYGNFFLDNSKAIDNISENCSPNGNSSSHFKTERGNYEVRDNIINEASDQNVGDTITGVSVAFALSYGALIKNIRIENNIVDGCYIGISVAGVDDCKVTGNTVKNYYQTGIAFITDIVGGANYDVFNTIVTENKILNMNDNSTLVSVGNYKNAGLQFEQNQGRVFKGVNVSNNVIEAKGSNTSKVPSYNVYIEASDEGVIDYTSDNNSLDSSLDVLPDWVKKLYFKPQRLSYTSEGSTATPTPIKEEDCYNSTIVIYNSNLELPPAKIGMKLSIFGTSSTSRLYVNGASDSATGTDSIVQNGQTTTNRNVQVNAPTSFVLFSPNGGTWFVSDGSASTLVA